MTEHLPLIVFLSGMAALALCIWLTLSRLLDRLEARFKHLGDRIDEIAIEHALDAQTRAQPYRPDDIETKLAPSRLLLERIGRAASDGTPLTLTSKDADAIRELIADVRILHEAEYQAARAAVAATIPLEALNVARSLGHHAPELEDGVATGLIAVRRMVRKRSSMPLVFRHSSPRTT